MIKNIDRKTLIMVIAGGVILLGMIAFSIYFFAFRDSSRKYEKRVEKKLEKLAISFYEDTYYDNVAESEKADIKDFEEKGIIVTLGSLQQVNGDDSVIVNEKTDEKCNLSETFVTIYPESPFKKSDYRIEYNLACGDF